MPSVRWMRMYALRRNTYIKHSAEQSVHQEIVSSLAENNNVSVQSQLSDLNAPSDRHLQDKSLDTDEQTDTNLSLNGGRRQLWLSQGHKVRQPVQKPETEQDLRSRKDVQEDSKDIKTPKQLKWQN